MKTHIKNIFDIAESKYHIDAQRNWSKGSTTYFEELQKEIQEVKEALDTQKMVYLEDELGDIFWDYTNLLLNLQKEGKIDAKRVFARCEKKYRERITAISQNISWNDIKQKQKQELQKEQEEN